MNTKGRTFYVDILTILDIVNKYCAGNQYLLIVYVFVRHELGRFQSELLTISNGDKPADRVGFVL